MKREEYFLFHSRHLEEIKKGIDIWNGRSSIEKDIRLIVLTRYAAHPSTQHMNERLVKIASRMARTGKTEKNANYYLIAANRFIVEPEAGDTDDNDDVDVDLDESGEYIYKRKRCSSDGTLKVVRMHRICCLN